MLIEPGYFKSVLMSVDLWIWVFRVQGLHGPICEICQISFKRDWTMGFAMRARVYSI